MMSFLQLQPEIVGAKTEIATTSFLEAPQMETGSSVKKDVASSPRIPDLLPDPKQIWW